MGAWLVLSAGAAGGDGWLTVLDQPVAKARAENKLILLFFTGSDWNDSCQKFDREVLSSSEFRAYAGTNLVLVQIDFPRTTSLDEPLKKANAAWQQRFRVQDFPTLVLVDSNCNEFGRQKGYTEGGSESLIKALENWKAHPPARSQLSATGTLWLTDLPKALALARAENKMVLLDFTGSDWCPWCIRLKQEVFSQPEFVAYANKNIVLVEVDFPRHKLLSPEQKQANYQLANQYHIEGYPTVIVLDSNGRKIGASGYEEGGPKPYVEMLDRNEKRRSLSRPFTNGVANIVFLVSNLTRAVARLASRAANQRK